MENSRKLKFFSKIALEYRLSLKNLCKLMGLEPTEENKKIIYDGIISIYSLEEPYMVEKYNYLFNYETVVERDEVSSKSYRSALIFLTRYVNAKKRNNDQAVKDVLKDLTETDRNFKELIKKELKRNLTVDDTIVISKYRIKYCYSRNYISNTLGINRNYLASTEGKIKDDNLKQKLKLLSEYNYDINKGQHK